MSENKLKAKPKRLLKAVLDDWSQNQKIRELEGWSYALSTLINNSDDDTLSAIINSHLPTDMNGNIISAFRNEFFDQLCYMGGRLKLAQEMFADPLHRDDLLARNMRKIATNSSFNRHREVADWLWKEFDCSKDQKDQE